MPVLTQSVAQLMRRQLIVVTGKGGVGKTLVTALLGAVFADAGRRVLLVETDPRESLHQLMDVPPSGGDIVAVRSGLFLQNLQPRRVLEQLVRERLRVEILVRRVLASPVFDHFAEGAPGLKELAVLGYALALVRGEERQAPPIDMVVLDAPASGHAASLVTAPRLVSEIITEGPFGRMAAELSAFVADANRTGIVAVTHADEMPVQETLELRDTLEQQFGRGPELLVINAVLPPIPSVAVAPERAYGSLLRLWALRRSINERELLRLEHAWRSARIELPLLPLDRGPALIPALRPAFEQAA
ncbi:MAG: ArsA family ATPase [Acidobacteriota bacterium]